MGMTQSDDGGLNSIRSYPKQQRILAYSLYRFDEERSEVKGLAFPVHFTLLDQTSHGKEIVKSISVSYLDERLELRDALLEVSEGVKTGSIVPAVGFVC